MAKAVLVTYLFALTICLISAYKQECAIGPKYWCESFQNAQDCGALQHCTNTVWRYDEKYTKIDSSTKCEWCQKIIESTHKAIQHVANHEDLIKSTLINGCKLLPLEDISSKCTFVIENYETTVLSLMKHQRYDTLCHLMDICPNELDENIEKPNVDEQSKMLCNVIVQATKELHVNQQKSRNEIEIYLKNDCQQLTNPQLAEKCEDFVEKHGNEVYAYVASNIELSKVCDYLDSSAPQSIPQVHCELCTFVLSIAKQMVDAKHTEDKVLLYIDEQICSRLSGTAMRNCKEMIDNNGRDLLISIQQGIQPMLLCTHFQVCLDQIVDRTSPIEKDEMHSFLVINLCEKLGSLKSACQALIEKDSTHLLQILTNEINGQELCHMFGLCPKKSLLLDQSSLKDDPSKCKRCVTDFTRRKHIAERLVNHSSEFLHHLCGQLPQQDDCVKAVDDSINELLTFIRTLDPKEICVQLNMCDERLLKTISTNAILPSDNILSEEILEYVKNDVCTKLGSLSSLCVHLADSEGSNLLNLVTKNIDPHRVCEIMDVCPSNSVFTVCHDKCQCCTNKIEIYQRQLEKFMRTIVASTRIMCDHVPGRDVCLQFADIFESNINKVVARFDPKQTCQLLSLCSLSDKKINEDQCETCKTELDIRQNHFRTTVNELTTILLSLCKDNDCRLRVQSTQEQTLDKINNINSQKLCQHLGYCISESSFEPSATVLRLKSLVQHQTKTLEERLEANNICSEYGQLKSVCEHLMTSVHSHRYAHVYMALLENNPKLVDDDLREQMKTNVKTDVCSSCKNAVQSSKDFWDNALESVRNVLLRTCEVCSAKDQCRDYYNQRFDNIKSYINNIDPDQFCQTIHLCSTTLCANMGIYQQSCEEALATFSHPQTLEDHLPHTSVVVLPTHSEEESEKTNDLTTDSNSNCILCEYVMNILSAYIHQKSTEDEIEQGLQQVCNQMPATLRTQCHELIENYGPSIIATLIREFDVSTICRKLNLCTNQMKVELTHLTKANTASCGICDYVSTYVHFARKRDPSEKSLKQALSTVCTHLSSEQTSQCQTLVHFIGSNINQLQLGSENNFCKQLTICQTPWSELKPAVHLNDIPSKHESITHKDDALKEIIVKNLDDAPQCMLCHYVVSYLDAILKNNQSEAEVEAALARVCTILPRKDRVQCNDFVKTYGPVLAELISQLADPKLVCRYLGMCQVVSAQEATTKESRPITYSNHHYARIPV